MLKRKRYPSKSRSTSNQSLVIEQLDNNRSYFDVSVREILNGCSCRKRVMYFEPKTLSGSIGNGLEFLNGLIASKMFHDKEFAKCLLDFLQYHAYKVKFEQSVMAKESIRSLKNFQLVLKKCIGITLQHPHF